MAGHSQFKNIMHRKGRAGRHAVQAAFSQAHRARSRLSARSRVCPIPAMPMRACALAIQNAKARSRTCPRTTIQRAINKASGAAEGDIL